MRRIIVPLLVAACVLLIVLLAYLQVNTGTIRAKVDLYYLGGSIHPPAGEYGFTLNTATDRIYITNRETSEPVSVFTRDIIDKSVPTESELVFQKDGDQKVRHRGWSRRWVTSTISFMEPRWENFNSRRGLRMNRRPFVRG